MWCAIGRVAIILARIARKALGIGYTIPLRPWRTGLRFLEPKTQNPQNQAG